MRDRFVRLLLDYTKQTINMVEVYSNDAVVFEGSTCIKMHGMQL